MASATRVAAPEGVARLLAGVRSDDRPVAARRASRALRRLSSPGGGELISTVRASGLRGRGGGAFPCGDKLAAVAAQRGRPVDRRQRDRRRAGEQQGSRARPPRPPPRARRRGGRGGRDRRSRGRRRGRPRRGRPSGARSSRRCRSGGTALRWRRRVGPRRLRRRRGDRASERARAAGSPKPSV